MTEFDNRNRGALFKDDRKQNEDDRDYSGSLDVDGVAYWISGWVKTSSKTGKKFLSLKIKPKVDRPKAKPEFEDSVPF
jgi:hypothetical protein